MEPRNTPTVINAIFNHRQFWDRRASNIFNGVNPFGTNDPHAYVYKHGLANSLNPVQVSINNASLASQAMAPPTSSLEMSADGRTWYDIGDQFIARTTENARKKARRIRCLRPLAQQLVHPDDSVLGGLSAHPRPGLNQPSYVVMIRAAFKPEWWSSAKFVPINANGSRTIVDKATDENAYSQMEMNFSLFFGLTVQLYEATLVSDDSPIDRYLDGDQNALTQEELVGFHLADD